MPRLNITNELQNLIIIQDSITWQNTQGMEEGPEALRLLEIRNELMLRIAKYVTRLQAIIKGLGDVV